MAKIDLEDYLEKLDEPEDREAVANREYQPQIFEQYVTSGDNFPERRAQLLRDYKTGKELTGPKGLRGSSERSTSNTSAGPTLLTTS